MIDFQQGESKIKSALECLKRGSWGLLLVEGLFWAAFQKAKRALIFKLVRFVLFERKFNFRREVAAYFLYLTFCLVAW